MSPTTAREAYIANKLVPSFRLTADMARVCDIKVERQNRCLSPAGRSFFMDAVRGYLAGCREEADELAIKAEAFLDLAHSIREQQKYSYAEGFSEGIRSATLAYVKWLRTGTIARELLADASFHLDSYFDRPGTLDHKTAELMTPTLLYLCDYALIEKLAHILLIGDDPADRVRASGLFRPALRIARASNELARQVEKEKLREKFGRQLMTWVRNGQYDSIAYALFAIFPLPEDRPTRLIEDFWQHVPDNLIPNLA